MPASLTELRSYRVLSVSEPVTPELEQSLREYYGQYSR